MASKYEDTNILKCRLCLSFLDIPKRLPCLHMFCEKCLCTLISSAAQNIENFGSGKFECPVCRDDLPSPTKSSDAFEYVSKIPTYTFIEAAIRREQITTDATPCGPCKRDGKKHNSDMWCMECDEGLCDSCHAYHAKMKILDMHKVVHIKNVKKQLIPITVDRPCLAHTGQKIDLFCRDHQTPCCYTCVATVHRKCHEVLTLNDATGNIREYCLGELNNRINEDMDALVENIQDGKNRFRELQADMDSAKDMAESLCEELKAYIDIINWKFQTELEQIHTTHIQEVETRTKKFEEITEIISNSQKLLQKLLESASDVNLFFEKDDIEKKVEEQENKMAEIAEPYGFKYEINLEPELVRLKSSIQLLGTIKCIKKSPVQQTVGQSHFISSTPQETATFSADKCDTGYVHGTESLSDGNILLTSYQQKSLCLYDTVGRLHKQVILPAHPLDVAASNANKAFVTYGGNGVCMVDVNTMNIKGKYKIHGSGCNVCGITLYGDRLFAAFKDRIVVMDTNGVMVKEIKTPKPDCVQRYITVVSDSKLCYTNPKEGSVICINMDGTEIFGYKHKDLVYPYGITLDNEGLVYVAGYGSNNVHQISQDGHLIKILFCKDHGVTSPFAIIFDQKGNLILTHSKFKITTYQMKK